MLWPERVTQQSSRPFDPVESFRPPRHKGGNKILDEDMQMSSELIRSTRVAVHLWPTPDKQLILLKLSFPVFQCFTILFGTRSDQRTLESTWLWHWPLL